ncbi:diadenosine tetraphosphate asymmetrical hydrolase [Mycena pura]|uniref:Diadenosine tetraphosphate asymmetrical hydrolase n=1 Tax=Mycena pura TaxID=153505 RepID=A0AAD6Y4I2_9AGAR|nr:diadenosine tetraphosphate asymmetrical hydrolase [Mycena pura]
MSPLFFSTIEVTRQAFYRSGLSFAIVNLKHVLVIPTRPVLRLADLNGPELSSLMRTVQQVGSVLERAYGADGLTVACQDGKAAGQSVPHVHFHLLPRKAAGDRFSGRNNDQIYPAVEKAEAELSQQALKVDADENRVARSLKEMEEEANWLKTFFQEGHP